MRCGYEVEAVFDFLAERLLALLTVGIHEKVDLIEGFFDFLWRGCRRQRHLLELLGYLSLLNFRVCAAFCHYVDM